MGRKSASKLGSNTAFAAAITTLSATQGMPSGRRRPGPARLRDVHPPQRPRLVRTGTQLLGELIEEVTNSAGNDVADGDAIDARRSAVCTDLARSPPEHVAAGDLVVQGVEAAILILLSAAVERVLEGTNPVHAFGVAERT